MQQKNSFARSFARFIVLGFFALLLTSSRVAAKHAQLPRVGSDDESSDDDDDDDDDDDEGLGKIREFARDHPYWTVVGVCGLGGLVGYLAYLVKEWWRKEKPNQSPTEVSASKPGSSAPDEQTGTSPDTPVKGEKNEGQVDSQAQNQASTAQEGETEEGGNWWTYGIFFVVGLGLLATIAGVLIYSRRKRENDEEEGDGSQGGAARQEHDDLEGASEETQAENLDGISENVEDAWEDQPAKEPGQEEIEGTWEDRLEQEATESISEEDADKPSEE